MFCHKCGNQIGEGAGFCNKCGAKVSTMEATQRVSVSSAQAVTQIPVQPTSSQPASSVAAVVPSPAVETARELQKDEPEKDTNISGSGCLTGAFAGVTAPLFIVLLIALIMDGISAVIAVLKIAAIVVGIGLIVLVIILVITYMKNKAKSKK